MGLFWTFLFLATLLYLSANLVNNIDSLDGWLKVLYFAVLAPGYSLVIFQVRAFFREKHESKAS